MKEWNDVHHTYKKMAFNDLNELKSGTVHILLIKNDVILD